MPGLWALPVYKVSYVAASSEHPGAIINRDHAPIIGERITLGEDLFEVVDVLDLMPPRDEFFYIHATVRFINRGEEYKNKLVTCRQLTPASHQFRKSAPF